MRDNAPRALGRNLAFLGFDPARGVEPVQVGGLQLAWCLVVTFVYLGAVVTLVSVVLNPGEQTAADLLMQGLFFCVAFIGVSQSMARGRARAAAPAPHDPST